MAHSCIYKKSPRHLNSVRPDREYNCSVYLSISRNVITTGSAEIVSTITLNLSHIL